MNTQLRKLPLHPSLKIRPQSHREKVKSLYKRSIQQIRNLYSKWGPLDVRYRAVKLRAEFEKYLDLKDMRVIKELMDKQEESIKQLYGEEPLKFPFSEDGVSYQREFSPPDVLLDHWTPYQKAQYPEFFAKREELKEEYLKLCEETYGDLAKNLGVERHSTYGIKPHDWKEGDPLPEEEEVEKPKSDKKVAHH